MQTTSRLISDFNESVANLFLPNITEEQTLTINVNEPMTPYEILGTNIKINEGTLQVEFHELTEQELTQKSFALNAVIVSDKLQDIALTVGGVAQIFGIDFAVESNSITWAEKSLADVNLVAGDIFIITYQGKLAS